MEIKKDGSSKGKIKLAAFVFMGLGHILYLKQYVKGAIYAFLEICFLVSLPMIIRKLTELVTLGEAQPHLPIKERDNSIFMLIDGVLILMLVIIFFVLYTMSIRNAMQEYEQYCFWKKYKTNKQTLTNISGKAFPVVGLAPAVLLVVFFVLVPLIFSACVAFTNYSLPSHIPPNNTVDWVGFSNFTALFGGNTIWAGALGRVALWTIIWAFLATFTCFSVGMLVAVILKEAKIKIAPVFRVLFILPYAVPSVVSMLVWANLLNGSFGIVNRTLQELNLLSGAIPWLSDPTMAKFTCVLINLWAGFPYFMLLATGTMTSISDDIYEAAKIDGASSAHMVKKITLPLVLYQTAPLLIMGFTSNINNFGAIYFLTSGKPVVADTTTTGAGGTDILVTWIYNLTMSELKYNYASVIAVMIFVIMAPFAVWNFRRTKAYKEGEV
jgi:ABC-type sugar transport systems, permease components